MKKFFPIAIVFLLLLSACGNSGYTAPKINYTEQFYTTPSPSKTPAPAAKISASDRQTYQTDRSTCFSSISYSPSEEKLIVTFRNSGKSYAYLDFSQADFDAFFSASSLGKYYNAHIKGNYTCQKLG